MDWKDSLEFTGIDSGYDYRQLPLLSTPSEMQRYCSKLRERWAPTAKAWTKSSNSEWMARCYLAVRFMAAATVMVASREFAGAVNLRIVRPYLGYYASLTCARALLLSTPELPWQDGTLLKLTHNKTLNLVHDKVCQLSPTWGAELKDVLGHLRDVRETFSYRFPIAAAAGKYDEPANDELVRTLRGLCELAQIHSECMQASLEKHGASTFREYDARTEDLVCDNEIAGIRVTDRDDKYRFGWLFRKIGRPANFFHTVSNGLVDDLFGGWEPADEGDEAEAVTPTEVRFNPWPQRLLLFEFE